MIRNLISKFSSSFTERRASPRKPIAVPVRVWFAPEKENDIDQEVARSCGLSGETVDISRTGIAFVVSSIRIKEKYLVGQNRKLNLEVDLPSGKIHLQVLGCRYNKVGEHLSMEKYLIGAEIVRISAGSDEAFDQFFTKGARREAVVQTA